MYSDILLPLITHPDASSESVATNAARVAKCLGAQLHAMALEVEVPDISNALSGLLLDLPKLIREVEESSRAKGQRLLQLVADKAASLGIECRVENIHARETEFGPVAANAARYHDLSLIGWTASNATTQVVAEALIFESGRPVVVLPEAETETIKHVAIAWDGSRVAARAVSDAMPFLRKAKAVSIIVVTDEKPIKDGRGAKLLADYLAKRGYRSSVHSVHAAGRPIGETLQAEAQKLGADLLVMGAYGHSRLRQFVLGGATSGVLEDLRMPVLLSH
uniref:UspA n=1 Tax=Chelativorans sp. (strain BNC1) TaxID=266779 RepID=Q11G37_CHESB